MLGEEQREVRFEFNVDPKKVQDGPIKRALGRYFGVCTTVGATSDTINYHCHGQRGYRFSDRTG